MEEFVRVADDEGMGKRVRLGYPSDVTDEEGAFVAPYLALCKQDAEQREYPLRDVFNGLRYIAKTGSQWRFMPNDFPLWEVVYQQMRRWIDAQCFETMVEPAGYRIASNTSLKTQPAPSRISHTGGQPNRRVFSAKPFRRKSCRWNSGSLNLKIQSGNTVSNWDR
jgi:hypothetical protein